MKSAPVLSRLHNRRARSGIVLLEIVVAICIFGMTALSLMKALSIGTQTALISQVELRMILRLQSTLTEYSKVAVMEEGSYSSNPDELGVYTQTQVVKLELQNADGQPLPEMFHVTVQAFYENFGQKGEMTADTYRYGRLYQPQQQAGTAAPAAPAP